MFQDVEGKIIYRNDPKENKYYFELIISTGIELSRGQVTEVKLLNKTIFCINQLYLRNINKMNKLQEFNARQRKKHMSKNLRGVRAPEDQLRAQFPRVRTI